MSDLPARIASEDELDEVLSRPTEQLAEMFTRLSGDLIILGVSGKMGPSLALLARRSSECVGVAKRIIGVGRFSNPHVRTWLESRGIETIQCDLTNPNEVARLPQVENVIFMAGRKFGEVGSEANTWIMNTVVPGNVARHFTGARTVVFSTGCVYPLVPPHSRGCTERDDPDPVGEYASSCLGRERVFEHWSRTQRTPVIHLRLNYAIDLRCGVLVDIADHIASGVPIDLAVSAVNVIWQGDANARALLCLERTVSPPEIINITGPKVLSVETLALDLGKRMGKSVMFKGSDTGLAYLSNAAKSVEWFGPPRISVDQMISWVADWVTAGGRVLGRPTHFSETKGQFLD